MKQARYGAIAAGHPLTAEAGAEVLKAGGNAFDAILAAMVTSCVTEPILASLGGGGFLLASEEGNAPVLYDFFTQTPKERKESCDFHPVLADFGTVTQEFHIGRGSTATPGVVKGLFESHTDLGRLPLREILKPAIDLARQGFQVTDLQASLFGIVEAIYSHSEGSRALYASSTRTGKLVQEGDFFKNPDHADLLEALSHEGSDLFYKGDVARTILQESRDHGGHLSHKDLEGYQVHKRTPLRVDYLRSHFYTNPAPSTGGLLISFALELVKKAGFREIEFGSFEHLERLSQIMALTNKARIDACITEGVEEASLKILSEDFLEIYRKEIFKRPQALRGTSHISVIDIDGNAASLTLSNGEGCGHVLPGCGLMLNNMLGEEDINPHGFNKWPEDVRMCSMMAPTLLLRDDGISVSLGSGGSNRIRTAILQVLINLLEFKHPLTRAVHDPRIHYERDLLNIEPGFEADIIKELERALPELKVWDARNLFFGGVHSVLFDENGHLFDGVGDPRRGGAALIV